MNVIELAQQYLEKEGLLISHEEDNYAAGVLDGFIAGYNQYAEQISIIGTQYIYCNEWDKQNCIESMRKEIMQAIIENFDSLCHFEDFPGEGRMIMRMNVVTGIERREKIITKYEKP